jgi:tetratricopeptide (TPR) repeat protein
MGLLDEAEYHLNEGLKVSQKTGSFRVKAGIQQATGKLYLRQGRLKEAKFLLDTALEAYRSSQEMTELGKTYCCISEYHHLLQERELALTALQEAKAIARSTGTSPHSELGKRISWMQDRL